MGESEMEDCFPSEDYYFDEYALTRKRFLWTDREGNKHKLSDISDYYLNNIISFLKQKGDSMFDTTIKFLEKEAKRRSKETK